MNFIENVKQKVKSRGPLSIVLPEYRDERIYFAAERLLKENLVSVVYFIGDEAIIRKKVKELNMDIKKVEIISIEENQYLEEFAEEYYALRKTKGITEKEAKDIMKNELYFGAMLVKKGIADGMVAGAMNTTADVVRAAIRVIGTKESINTVSSFFVMVVPDSSYGENGILFFADSGVVINPTASQLADIAICTADSMKAIIDVVPRVAFLSFSTKGSATHPLVDKIKNALEIAHNKRPDILMDGELQADTALVSRVAKKKAPDSKIAGRANILIFPDLNSGNIAYKLVQYLGKAEAYGPILQGLAKPVNDLSRGCSVEDIVGVACITQLQTMI